MAGFDDFIKALQFGVGLASGFSESAQKSRQDQDANTLRLLTVLGQDPNFSFQPVQGSEVQRGGGLLAALFGGGRNQLSGTGEPVYTVGGQSLVRREAPPIPIPPGLFPEQPSSPGAPVGAPMRPFNVPGGASQPQETPLPTPLAPQATPRPRGTLAPATRSAPAGTPAPEARAARASRAYGALAPEIRTQIDAAVEEAARLYPNVPRERILATIGIESNFDPAAVSPRGAQGLMQLMPGTSQELGVTDATNIRQNILGGTKYLAQQLQAFKDPGLASAAYNAGPGKVTEHKGIPPFAETREYVPAVQIAESLFASRGPDQRVAGPGAVAARAPSSPSSTPTAPEIPGAPGAPTLELPPPRGAEEFINDAQRNVYRTLAPQLRNTVQGQQRLGTALNEATQRGTLRAEREFRTARTEAERIKKDRQIHSYEVLNALDQVQDTRQLKTVIDYMDKYPEPDHLGDSLRVLARTPDAQLSETMAKLYPQLLAANYNQEQIKYAWKVFEKKAELPGVLEEERQKIRAKAEQKPYEQALALPGEVRETSAKEEARLKIQRAQYAPLIDSVAKQPATFHALPAEARGAILPDLVQRGITADQLEAPGVVEQRRLTIQRAQADLDKTAREKAGQYTAADVEENALKLRAAIRQEPKFKIAQEITSGLGNIRVGKELDNAAGDLAIVNGYAKILDPTSIIHPAEFKTVEEAQGFFQRLKVAPFKFWQGDRLAPEVRKNFLAAAEKLGQDKFKNAAAEIEPVYRPRAKGLGVNFDEIFLNPFGATGAAQPAAPAGANQGLSVIPPDVPRQAPANDPLGLFKK